MSNKQVAAVIVVAAVAGFVLGRLSTDLRFHLGGGSAAVDSSDHVRENPGPIALSHPAVPTDDAPFLGPGAAKVTIVEFSDFECPYCRRGYAALDEILDTYDDDVRLVYRHLPLPMHANAQMAAEASLAAGAQGKFWPFHDLLFNNQRSLSPEAIRGFAEELGLDMDAFSAALEAHTYADQVAADVQTARELGLGGTPSFMINGRPLVGAKPPAAFAEIIDEEIAAADELLADGVPLREVYRRRVEANLARRPDRADAEGQPAAQGAAREAESEEPAGEQSERR